MSVFLACIIKDIKLFFSKKSGIAILVLPVVLLLVLSLTSGDLYSASTFVEPFPVAMRDEDSSFISRSLLVELRTIELFETVDRVKDPEITDEELFKEGYAAILTIPKDYFYSMYDMNNLAVTVSLNPEMPAEAGLVRSLISSVVNIVSAEQKAWSAEYGVRAGGDLNREQLRELWYESANHELVRALKRGSVFASVDIAETFVHSSLSYAYAAVSSVICMLLPLCALKGLPEERRLNITVRYRSIRPLPAALLMSRYVASLLLFLLPEALITLFLRQKLLPSGVLGLWAAFTASYELFAVISMASPNAARIQSAGNLVLAASLLLGGVLYPYPLLPGWAQKFSPYTIPFRLTNTLSGDMDSVMLLLAAALLLTVLALLLSPERRRKGC